MPTATACSTGGLGAHYGLEAIGATVVADLGRQYRPPDHADARLWRHRHLLHTSYFLHLIERAGELGVDLRELPLRAGIFGAEPWSDGMRQRIEKDSGIKAYDIYGLSEIIGPGVGSECSAQAGLHIFEDHSTPKSSTRKPARFCPMEKKANWCLPPCPSAPCR